MTKKIFDTALWNEIDHYFRAKGKKKIRDINVYRRIQTLYLRGCGGTRKEVSEIVGFCEQYITDLVAKCKKYGLEAAIKDARTSNNRRMSFEEEEKFLERFLDIAEAGQIVTVSGILEAFENETCKKSNTSTICKLLKRHGWRKVKPRPQHPDKASDAEIELEPIACWKNITKIEMNGER